MLQIRRGPSDEIVLEGRFDASQSGVASEVFDALTGSASVDCSGLDYISSLGLGVLLKTQKRLAVSGGALKLVRVNRHIEQVLRYAGFDHVFEIESEGKLDDTLGMAGSFTSRRRPAANFSCSGRY